MVLHAHEAILWSDILPITNLARIVFSSAQITVVGPADPCTVNLQKHRNNFADVGSDGWTSVANIFETLQLLGEWSEMYR